MSLLDESFPGETAHNCNTTKMICAICTKSFSTSGNLKSHIATIHNDCYPYNCTFPGCNRRYSNRSRLETHLRTHKGEKPYECKFCQKKFNENGNLKTHLRLHSLQRPFTCELCWKTYKTNGHLKDHMNIRHLKIKKFECGECNKSFGRSSTLKAHKRIHTGEKPFRCLEPTCNKSFSEKGNMQIHYKRHMKKSNSNEKLSLFSEECNQYPLIGGHDYNFNCSSTSASNKEFNNLEVETPININIIKKNWFETMLKGDEYPRYSYAGISNIHGNELNEHDFILDNIDEVEDSIFEINQSLISN